MEELNEFIKMWNNYPSPNNALEVAFGKENSPYTSEKKRRWLNTFNHSCCIRLSHAVNSTYCHQIRRTVGVRTEIGAKGHYIYAVPDFSIYLKDRYGNPDYQWSGDENTKQVFKREITTKKGIILFFDYVGGLRGHADLWDEGEVGSYDLFDACSKIEFWEVKL